jgi:hypothetical protein
MLVALAALDRRALAWGSSRRLVLLRRLELQQVQVQLQLQVLQEGQVSC